jgi:hypothetical protein
MTYTIEEVFRTERVPEFTYVRPHGKPVVIEAPHR